MDAVQVLQVIDARGVILNRIWFVHTTGARGDGRRINERLSSISFRLCRGSILLDPSGGLDLYPMYGGC